MSSNTVEIINVLNNLPTILERAGYLVIIENGQWKFDESLLDNNYPPSKAPVLHIFSRINETQAREIMALPLTPTFLKSGLPMRSPRGHYYATYYKGRQYLQLNQKKIVRQIRFTSSFAYAKDFVGQVEEPWIIDLQ